MSAIALVARRVDSRFRLARTVGELLLVGGLGWALAACSAGGARPPSPGQDAAVAVMDSSMLSDAAMSSQDASVSDSGGDLTPVHPDLALSVDLAHPVDLGAPADLAVPVDLAVPADLSARADLAAPVDLRAAPDLAYPSVQGVDIYVDNTCRMDVIPKAFDVPSGTTLKLTFNNRSRDYAVTVWMSYGGGYTDLATGSAWNEPILHCRLPRPYHEYADISTACSSYRMMINCL